MTRVTPAGLATNDLCGTSRACDRQYAAARGIVADMTDEQVLAMFAPGELDSAYADVPGWDMDDARWQLVCDLNAGDKHV